MELAESMEESVEDITAADTAPRPKKETHWKKGNRFLTQQNEISLESIVRFELEKKAEAQINTDQQSNHSPYITCNLSIIQSILANWFILVCKMQGNANESRAQRSQMHDILRIFRREERL